MIASASDPRGEAVRRTLTTKLQAAGLVFDAISTDTTSNYFESDYDDEEWSEIAAHDAGVRKRAPTVSDPPLRMRGHSKDKRANKPQVVVEAAVSEGYVIHHDTHPGNTSDKTLIGPTARKLVQRGVGQGAVWVGDAGMNSAKTQEALGELRVDWVFGEGQARTKEVKEVLSQGGRFRQHPDKPELAFKTVTRGDRLYVIRLNRSERQRVLRKLGRHLKRIEEELSRGDRATDHGRRTCRLVGHPTLGKYVRRAKRGDRLVLNRAAIERERTLAGKSVVSTNMEGLHPLPADDLYRLLFNVEDAFRSLKSDLDLRPIRHRRSNRIRAHVLVCVMALNVTRHLERKTGRKLSRLRDLMTPLTAQQLDVGPATFWESVTLTEEQEAVFEALGYDRPLKRFDVTIE